MPVIRRLYDKAVECGGEFSWGGGESPSVTVFLTVGTIRTAVWRCRTRPDATLVLMFDWMQGRGVAPERMQRFVDQLRGIPGVAEQLDEARPRSKRPRIPISLLAAPGAADTVASALEEFLGIQG